MNLLPFKAYMDIVIMIFYCRSYTVGPAHLDRWCSTSTLLSRMVPLRLVSLWSLCVCTGYIKVGYVVKVLMLSWLLLIYEPLFSVLHIIVALPKCGRFFRGILSLVLQYRVISRFLHFLCIFCHHTVMFIYILFSFFTLLYNSKLYSQRTLGSSTL